MSKPIENITVSVRNKTGKPSAKVSKPNLSSTAHILITVPPSTAATGGGAAPVQWAKITQIPEYNVEGKDKYIVQKATLSGTTWTLSGVDIDIEHAINYDGSVDSSDIRNWVDWYDLNSYVRIIEKLDTHLEPDALAWFIDEPMLYGGNEAESSLRHSEDLGHTVIVWS